MNKRSLYSGISLAAFVALALPLHAEGPAGQFFGTLDYYLAGDVADEIETDAKDGANALTASGDPSTAETEVDDGIGGRIGYLRNVNPHFSMGGSLGYIVGPKIDSTLTVLPGGISGIMGDTNIKVKSSYLRLMAEGVGKYPLNKKVSLNLGLAAGIAQAKTEQESTIYLTDGIDVISGQSDEDESVVGFSWEISPSVDFNLETVALSLGLRYSQFPKIKGTDDRYEIDWKAIGFFAGMKF